MRIVTREDLANIKVVADNTEPDKPKRVRLSSVAKYCPACKSNTWILVNIGPANVIVGTRPARMRCCVHCLSKGSVITW